MEIELPYDLSTWDQARFQSLYDDYYSIMVAFAMRMLNVQDDAEDVVQDVFTQLWVKAERFASKAMLVRFLYVSVHNRCLDVLKHAKVEQKYSVEYLATNSERDDLEGEIFASEIYSRLYKKIDELPERQKATILLAMKGKSNAEIAEEMHVAVDTVKNQKMKAYKTLRKSFTETALISLLPCLFV